MWNEKFLEPPANSTYKTMQITVDIMLLKRNIQEAMKQLYEHENNLKAEAATLSRCIYRMKLKFRKDKGLKAMEKTNRALRQYLQVNILKILESYYDTIPVKYESQTYLPTRNMLDYVLVRLQGVSKLCVRIGEVSKEIALNMENKIAIGHFWKVAMIAFSIGSRMWILMKNITEVCCDLFSKLVAVRNQFQNISVDWLPPDYNLLIDLKEWSGALVVFKDTSVKETYSNSVLYHILNQKDVDDEDDITGFNDEQMEFEDDIQETDVQELKKVPKTETVKEGRISNVKPSQFWTQSTYLDTVDLGEVIDRNEIMVKVSKTNHDVEKINKLNSLQDIKRFMKHESLYRQFHNSNSISKHISDQQWTKLKKSLNNCMKKGNNEDSVSKIQNVLRKLLCK